ncbi:MAG: SRPBCC family protein [Oleiphilaceae bacterium]|nr:SRPBCC family protein [Oleiphilaceae bacterium]
MRYPDSNRIRSIRSRFSSPRDPAIAVAALGLTAAGAAWYLRANSSSSRSLRPASLHLPRQRKHNHTGWLLGAVGAGIAGMLLGSRIKLASASGVPLLKNEPRDVRLVSNITIKRPAEEVYRFWRDFQNLPQVMGFLDRIEPREGNISHWVAKGPAGPAIEWDAEIVDDDPGKLLAWRSLEGSDIQTWGTVIFRPGKDNRETEVAVAFNFSPPANAVGYVARFLATLENAALDRNLRKLKSQMEKSEGATGHRFKTAGSQ